MPWWLWWLILGALIAWLVEWLIDWFYWRSKLKTTVSEWQTTRTEREQLQAQLRSEQENGRQRDDEFGVVTTALLTARSDLEQTQSELAAAHARENDWNTVRLAMNTDIDSMRGALVAAQDRDAEIDALYTENDELRIRLADLEAEMHKGQRKGDPLVDINGIGPVYQKRLYEAGIFTFAEVAEMTEDRLREIIQPQEWQQLDFATWRAEAKIFAEGGELNREPQVRQRRVFRSARDKLERIDGISAVYEQRLWAAGILTFDQLARRQASDIRQILNLNENDADVKAWITEAERLAHLRAELVEYSFESSEARQFVDEREKEQGL